MVNITINGKKLSVAEGQTIMNAAKENGIIIPSLCYLEGVNEIGACRVCVVEIEGSERLAAACNTLVQEGMVIHTNSFRVIRARQNNVRLILSAHDCHCPDCPRNRN